MIINNTSELKELAKQQLKTDKEMCKTHNLNMNSLEWFNNRIIALTVEFVETMQVTEDFKDWKINKGKIDLKRFKYIGMFFEDYMFYLDGITDEEISYQEALKRTLIEECADSLHFVLSLMNLFKYNGKIDYYDNISLSQCIVNSMYELMAVQQSYLLSNCNFDKITKDHFRLFINYLFTYYDLIGVSASDLIQAYWDKNKVNFERMENGY